MVLKFFVNTIVKLHVKRYGAMVQSFSELLYFRMKLIDSLKREPASSQSQKPSAPSSIVATTSSNGKAARYNAGPSAFARRTASHYHMMRKKKTNSARSQQVFEQESHF